MKKYIIVALLILIGISVNAQKHEVKLDIFDLIAFKALDGTYQYILNEESAVGISFFASLADKKNIFNYREDFTVTPFYRQYFPVGALENVFVEGFFAINTGTGTSDDGFRQVNYTDGAFGLAGGKSFISPRGFVLDLYVGLGRNLFESEGAPNLVPRIGINTGFRF